jgi:hypothetical protein
MNQILIKGIQQIERYIVSNRLKDAYAACGKLLLNFPENGKLHNLKKKIEKLVFKQNLVSVKKDLDLVKPLWNEKKYAEIIQQLKKLQSYVPGYAPVENQLEKAKKLYEKQQIQLQKDTIKNYIKSIGDNMQQKNFEKAIPLAKQLLKKIPTHEQVQYLLEKSIKLLIDQKIHNNQQLLSSNKFGEIQKSIQIQIK